MRRLLVGLCLTLASEVTSCPITVSTIQYAKASPREVNVDRSYYTNDGVFFSNTNDALKNDASYIRTTATTSVESSLQSLHLVEYNERPSSSFRNGVRLMPYGSANRRAIQ